MNRFVIVYINDILIYSQSWKEEENLISRLPHRAEGSQYGGEQGFCGNQLTGAYFGEGTAAVPWFCEFLIRNFNSVAAPLSDLLKGSHQKYIPPFCS